MSVAGTYEFNKPGSLEKSLQTITIHPDGRVDYTESGETSMESWNSTGHGRWEINGDVCQIWLDTLSKTMAFKKKTLVPGIEDGTNVRHNVTIPIYVHELTNAPKHGSHKWRRKE